MKKTVINIILSVLLGFPVFSQEWRIDTVNVFYPTNVYSLETIGDDLYVGGDYYTIGGVIYKSLAKWDSLSFSHLGSGSNTGDIKAFKMFNNVLYAAGGFSDMEGNTNIDAISTWNGTTWNAVGTETINGNVFDLQVYDGLLFICGDYTTIGTTVNSTIAAWDGTNYINVGSFPIATHAIEEYNGELYAGGYYHSLSKYAGGTTWVDVAGKNDNITDMLVDTFNNFLYVAGFFDMLGQVESDGLAMWDGYNWYGISNGSPYNNCNAIQIYRGDIYFGGYNIMIDGKEHFIARWTGTEWDTLGLGINSPVAALEVYKDELYVGGYFDTVNGHYCPGLARWYVPPDTTNCRYLQPRLFTTANADTFYMNGGQAEVQFYNNNAYVDTWSWNFGDAGADNIRNPIHTYTDTGTFDVEVIVSHDYCTDTASKTITILQDTGTGATEIENLKFKIYPNPTGGNFYAELDQDDLKNSDLM